MSFAYRARKKAMKRAADEKDPDRKEIRNKIRSGKVPRMVTLKRATDGRLPPRGRYNFKNKTRAVILNPDLGTHKRIPKRFFVQRWTDFIKFSSHVILSGNMHAKG